MNIKDFFQFGGTKQDKSKDPVCGMNVNLKSTKYKSFYKDKEYVFCSYGCMMTFDQNPPNYVL